MPRNPNKRPCAVPGCRAWAMRGRDVCASHRKRAPGHPAAARPAPLTADYTLDDLAAHAALALNRLEAWYNAQPEEDNPRWMLAYVRQLYQCIARLSELWKQRATLGTGQLAASLNSAVTDLQNVFGQDFPHEEEGD